MNKLVKTYRYERSWQDVVWYEVFVLDNGEYMLCYRNTKSESGWLGFKDTFEEVTAMLPSEATEVK